MNSLDLVINSDKFFAKLDSEFQIVATNNAHVGLTGDKYPVTIMDSRPVAQMRAEIQKIYKENVVNCKQ